MEKIQYKNTEKFTPEVIDEVLEVKDKYGLTAENLLKKASKKSSSLYGFFDWDNSSAGEKWRLHQARMLINEVKIVVEDKELYAFENVRVNIEDSPQPSNREYKSKIDIANNKDWKNQLIRRSLLEIKYWQERYSELIELQEIFSAIKIVEEKWQKQKTSA
jgi:hypothetical protein